MNYIIAINGTAVGFAQDEASARLQAKSCGGDVFCAWGAEDDPQAVMFFGRLYVELES